MITVKNNFEENIRTFSDVIKPELNFDIIEKNIVIGGKKAKLYMIDSFVKDELLEKLLEYFYSLKSADIPGSASSFADMIPHIDVGCINDMKEAAINLLSGMTVLFMEGYEDCFVIDCRTYPARGVSEPWKNRVLRGSRDGFVETIVSNIALVRRRIRTEKFRVESMLAGNSSNTEIAIAYIDGLADKKLIEDIKKRIGKISVDALTMNLESLAELLLKGSYINPFPKFKYTERPDSAAAAIFDGNIVIFVDNSPAVMILPTSIFDISEEADDYYFPPLTGTYLKLSRYFISVFSLLLTPVWVLFLNNPEWVPKWLEFVLIKESNSTIPILVQLFILEFAIDGLRLAAVNTPTLLSTPLSVIAGIVVGEYAVSSGWFDSESLLYMAFVSIGTYTQASYEIGYAIKFFRMIILALTWFFSLWGFIAGVVFFVLCLCFNKTISGKSYIYPIIPFNWQMIKRKVLRLRLGKEKEHQS